MSRYCLGKVPPNTLIGEEQVIFGSQPIYSMDSLTYCSIGLVSAQNINELLKQYPHIHSLMKKEILDNPYDYEREYFV